MGSTVPTELRRREAEGLEVVPRIILRKELIRPFETSLSGSGLDLKDVIFPNRELWQRPTEPAGVEPIETISGL